MGGSPSRDDEGLAVSASPSEAGSAHGPVDGQSSITPTDPETFARDVTAGREDGASSGEDDRTRSVASGPIPARRLERITPTIPGYQIHGELGRGGMGVVYRGTQIQLNRPCALKMILFGEHADDTMALRFLGEAQAIARLTHPSVVQIHHVGESAGLPFLELEYVDGGSLDKHLDGTPWPARKAVALVVPLAQAVAEAHRAGLVHRDLKPGNVLLAADGTPKITDFGLAKLLTGDSGLTATDSILGTPSYMAPEQAEGKAKQVGPLADVYSLGAILYTLLTGRPPFRGTTPLETLEQVKTAEPVRPSRLAPRLSRDVETITLKCLEKEPARRYSSAVALANDLRRVLDGEPILARPVSFWEKGWKWARRRPVVAALIVAVHLLLVALLGLWGSSYRQVSQTNERLSDALSKAKAATATAEKERSVADALRADAVAERTKSQKISASLALDRGLNEAREGKVGLGLLWMAESLELAPPEDVAFAAIAKANLAGWRAPLTIQRLIVNHDDRIIDAAALSPDGRMFVTGGRDGTARRWDAATGAAIGEPLRLGPQGASVRAVAFDSAGQRIAAGCEDERATQVWDARDGTPIGPLVRHPDSVNAIAFTPDGNALLVGTGVRSYPVPSSARLIEVQTGRFLTPPLEHPGSIRGVAIFPDGKTLVTGAMDHSVRFWDASDGRPLGEPLMVSREVKCLALSPSGAKLAVGTNDGMLAIYQLPDRRRIGAEMRHPSEVLGVAFHPNEAIVATGCMDGNARLWDWESGRTLGAPLAHLNYLTGTSFSRDGLRLLTCGEDKLARLWDLALVGRLGTPLLRPDPALDRLAFDRSEAAPRFKTVITGDRGRPVPGWVAEYLAASFSPDGRLVVVGCADATARVYDLATGAEIGKPMRHDNWVRSVAFGPDNRSVLTASHDAAARLWDARTGEAKTPWMRHTREVVVAAISPDGARGLTGGSDWVARLWDLSTGKPIGPPMGHDGPLHGVSFSRDGHRALTASNGGDVREWDAATAIPIGPNRSHGIKLLAARYDDDDRTVLTATLDGDHRRWHPSPSLAEDVSPADARLWARVVTGHALDASGAVSVLNPAEWTRLRADLQGGSLDADLEPDSTEILAWHDEMAGDYEWHGPTEAATWHLNRLLEARPQDPVLWARLGLVLHRAEEISEAGAALNRAVELGGAAAAADACRARAGALERRGAALEAEWYRRWVAERLPAEAEAQAELGRNLARQGRFADAASLFARSTTLAPGRFDLLRELALARLGAKDREGYRGVCAAILTRARGLGAASVPIADARLAAQTCILTPDAVAEWSDVVLMARRAREGYAGDRRLVMAALLRAGKLDEALRVDDPDAQAITYIAWEWLIRGTLLWCSGQADQARKTWDRPFRWMDSVSENIAREQRQSIWWTDWLYYVECQALRAEAEALLTGAPPPA
jgi:WD40 repeat protein/serine/threonine protein kinase/tetratricopeptide (TPR) repeat protein